MFCCDSEHATSHNSAAARTEQLPLSKCSPCAAAYPIFFLIHRATADHTAAPWWTSSIDYLGSELPTCWNLLVALGLNFHDNITYKCILYKMYQHDMHSQVSDSKHWGCKDNIDFLRVFFFFFEFLLIVEIND